MNKLLPKSLKLWQIALPLLLVANLAYLPKEFFGWIVTLGFFLFVPGYLLLTRLKLGLKSILEVGSFSLGLSLLILMASGLALNSLHFLGLSRPLTTPNIFITLDIVSLALITLNRSNSIKIPKLNLHLKPKQSLFILTLTLLPLLSIGGAIRLNNGASNILTMVLFGLIPLIFLLLLVWHNELRALYPYAIFTMGLSILFSNSLRGWFITGHDIHHEFSVFQTVALSGYWHIVTSRGDPYNACLSITILPTIIAKITSIPSPYVYKAVFQIIFALGLAPIYQLVRKFGTENKALVGAFIFISFPTFLNDMPFLNRQEIAFVFFSLLLLTSFIEIAKRPKIILTMLLLLGLVFSHYSSSYVTIGMLLLAWIFYRLLFRRHVRAKDQYLPLLSLPIILGALLLTFLWNVQVTSSSANLDKTIDRTLKSLAAGPSKRDSFVQYSLFNPGVTQTSESEFQSYARQQNNGQVLYTEPTELPITKLGNAISSVFNIGALNNAIHGLVAKVLQLLVLIGVFILIVRRRQKMDQSNRFLLTLACAAVTLLALFTLMPQLSVDYDVTRLFQQTLMVLWLPIIVAAECLFFLFGRFRHFAVAVLFALLFLDLSGFIPQATGEFLPQLPLNNSGVYYDFFYTHKSDILATQWLAYNRSVSKNVFMDSTSSSPVLKYPVQVGFVKNKISGYFYQSYPNVNRGVYRIIINGVFIEYSDPSITYTSNLLYANQGSRVYYR